MTSLLVQTLPEGPLDIIGDIHGEREALESLLKHLAYQEDGHHEQGRTLVFIGDYCDRGPDSPGTIKLIKSLIENGKAKAILGNHEINLLTDDAKDGSGWFFEQRFQSDAPFYAPFQRTVEHEKENIRQFLSLLPVALERKDIRIVHACWDESAINSIRHIETRNFLDFFQECEEKTDQIAQISGLLERYTQAREQWKEKLEDPGALIPTLDAYCEYDYLKNTGNPVRVLTSGAEARAESPFFAGNRWRFSDRTAWWDDYSSRVPVVFGHYWRLLGPADPTRVSRYSLLFKDIQSKAWFGPRRSAFCVDYSVGARWRDRKRGVRPEESRFHLAALRWPERTLLTDTGVSLPTQA